MKNKQTFLQKLEAAYDRVYHKVYDNRHKPMTEESRKYLLALKSLPTIIGIANQNKNYSIQSYWELVTELNEAFDAKSLQILKQSVINYYAESDESWIGAESVSHHVGDCEFRLINISNINDELEKAIKQAKIDFQSNIDEQKDLELEYKQSIL